MINKKNKSSIKTLVLILFLAYSASATNFREKIDSYVSSYVRTNDFSGCVLIKKNQNVQYSDCFGKANVEFGVSNTLKTKFKIGSISKQFTAAGILLLEEQGKLKTDDFVSKHLPEYESAKKIKIHHLLTHTSGLINKDSLPNYREINRKSLSLKELTDEIFKNNLLSEPGKTYSYSNSGFAVLARIIEKISGTSYGEFLSENIFQPLKMNSTKDYFDNMVEENLAVGYDPKGYDKLIRPDYVNNVFLRGSGSLFSTIDDLTKWIEAIRDGKILNQKSRTKFLTNHNNNYGYGISVYKSFGKKVFGHDGRVSGYIADYLHYQDDNISIIILGNIQTGVANFLRRDIAAIIFEKEYKSRAKTILSNKSYPKHYKEFIGKYQFAPNFFVYIEEFEGVLKARANEGSYSELVPLSDGRYFSRMLYSYISFEFDEKKKTSKLIWLNSNGNKFEGTRVK